MKEEYAAPSTSSPPAQPSAWQVRFGKKSASRSQFQRRSEAETSSHHKEEKSPSISDQLLRSLNAKATEKEDLSQECVDVLIGRRNAFATEPDLRLRTQTKCFNNEIEPGNIHADVAAEAKEIIRARLQIETHANSLRQTPEIKCSSKPRTTRTPTNYTSRTAARKSKTCYERKNSRIPLEHRENNNQKTTTSSERPAFQPRATQQERFSSTSKASSKNTRSRQILPKQLPMERRQQLRLEAREVRKIKAEEDSKLRKLQEPVAMDNNKEELQEQRRIEQHIERLTLENQEAVALEERLQSRKNRLRCLSKVFEEWQQCVEYRRELQTRVLAEFKWRILKSLVTQWKRFTHRQRQAKTVEQARLKLLQQQQAYEKATSFYRVRCLPKWFYLWLTFVRHQKEERAIEQVAEKRRAQTERLMERLLRQKSIEELQLDAAPPENDPKGEELPPADTILSPPTVHSRKTPTSNVNHRKSAWTSTKKPQIDSQNEAAASPETSVHLSGNVKCHDKVYNAMEQRAVERKRRREELKKRYEENERKKREWQEEQRTAREALILQQRRDEKANIRERKLAEATALKKKQDRREFMLFQRHKANDHNRMRLLFYYALLPWRKHQELSKRVARNACRWHDLRTVYSHWGRWLQFLQSRRKLRRHRERALVQEAAQYYENTLQRRALWGFIRYHQATESRTLAVRRQSQWNALRSSWCYWYKRLKNERAYQRKVVFEAVAKLKQQKLRRICAHWRKVTLDAKLQHELEREKQQLWRKVRGWLDEEEN